MNTATDEIILLNMLRDTCSQARRFGSQDLAELALKRERKFTLELEKLGWRAEGVTMLPAESGADVAA